MALADVPSVESGVEKARQILRDLDAERAADIECRQRMRRELAAVMENRAVVDMPQDFRTLADDLTETQRPPADGLLRHLHTRGDGRPPSALVG
ncbi:hypothetical protein OG245_00320 [Streptomyces sp. NBC_01116]|uniref:hypothetical protein n=1 Tax=Streptomyces sp. NBC_01116 TaxID=2903752 RepID=UPI00324931BE